MNRTITCAAAFAAIVSSACTSARAIRDGAARPDAHKPRIVERVMLPQGARASAAWVGALGESYVALADGRVLAIDRAGGVHSVDRFPGESSRAMPVVALADRGSPSPLLLVQGGAMAIDRGMLRRAPLPDFLSTPVAFAPCGQEALWSTGEGLFATQGARWLKIDLPAARSASAIASFDDGAWVRVGDELQRVRVDARGVTWLEAMPGVDVGAVRSIARVDRTHGIVAGSGGVALVGTASIRAFRGDSDDGAPQVVGGGGGWGWVGWAGEILRTNGDGMQALVGDVALGERARIAVDGEAGDSAIVIDENGDVLRVVADDVARTSGVADGDTLVDPRLELEVIAPLTSDLKRVSFALDGKEIASRTQPPWGIGDGGARTLDRAGLAFGAHRIDVVADDARGFTTRRSIQLTYASPFGRVPTFGADVVPIVASRCARCHAGGVARELSSYAEMSGQASLVRAAIREKRMPPDILLDAASAAILTAWVDGGTPR